MNAVKLQENNTPSSEENQKFLFPDQPGGIVNVPHYLIRAIPADEQVLLYYLSSRTNSDSICWPSNNLIAKDLKWSIDKVNRNKKRLVNKGLIQIIPTFNKTNPGQTSNRYKIPKSTHVQNYMGGGKHKEASNLIVSTPTRRSARESYADMQGPGDAEVSNEVLTIEELINEELTREELIIQQTRKEIFRTLVDCVFPTLDSMYGFNKTETAKKIESKLWGAAARIHEHYGALEGTPLPDYRHAGVTGNETIDGWSESTDQIKAYADFSRLSNWQLSTNPETIDEKIVGKDWCDALYQSFGKDIEKFDPGYDTDLWSHWLKELHYYDIIALGCERYSDRIVFDGLEYLLSKDGRAQREQRKQTSSS